MTSAPRDRQTAAPAGEAEQRSFLYYVYCVVERGSDAHRALEQGDAPGLEPGETLFPIEEGGLVAAASRVPAETFQEGPLNQLLQDLARLSPYAVRHEEAIRALRASAPALAPLTFGAVYQSRESVLRMLRDKREQFQALLEKVRDKEEWGLKVRQDPDAVVRAVAAHSDKLKDLDQRLAGSSPGKAYLLRKQRGQVQAAEARRLMQQWLDELVQPLAALSADVRVDDLAAARAESSDLIFKAALLTPSRNVAALRAAAAEADQRFRGVGLLPELNGPWPAYSFMGARHGAH